MAFEPRLGSPSALQLLAERLRVCPEVTRFDTEVEDEASTLADSLADLEQSFLTFLNDLLPKLTGLDSSPSQTYETLLDIGEEFRHALYHIKDARFFHYLQDADQ